MTIDLTPLYRSSVGFDRFASLLDGALGAEPADPGYPPYNIEATGDNRYAITLAVAGFSRDQIDIRVESGVLTVSGTKPEGDPRQILYQGIASGEFRRSFDLAEFVEVTGAELKDGLLSIGLEKRIPEDKRPRKIPISGAGATLEHEPEEGKSGEGVRDSEQRH